MRVLLIALLAAISYAQTETVHWSDEVVAFAYTGGGHGAAYASWATSWVFANRYQKKEHTMFDNMVVSANSGGNFFVSDLVYDEFVAKSFEERTKECFLKTWDAHVDKKSANILGQTSYQKVKDGNCQHSYRLDQNENEGVTDQVGEENSVISVCKSIRSLGGSFAEMLANACEVLDNKFMFDWRSYLKALNGDYRSAFGHPGFDYWSITVLVSQSAENLVKTSEEQEQLYYYTIERKGEQVPENTLWPVYINYGSNFDINSNSISIPHLEDEGEYEKRVWYRTFYNTWNKVCDNFRNWNGDGRTTTSKFYKFDKTAVKEGILNSGIQDPALAAGPSSGIFEAALSSDIVKNLIGFSEHSFIAHAWMLLAETLEIEASGPWEFDVNYAGEQFKLALGDGAYTDNTAISASIYGLQQRDKLSGIIFSVSTPEDIANLFEIKDYAKSSWSEGAHGSEAIFAGRYNHEMIETVGKVYVAVYEVQTVNNAKFGVVAGSNYTLVAIAPLPPTALPWVIGGPLNTRQQFKDYGADILEDISFALEYVDTYIADRKAGKTVNNGKNCWKACGSGACPSMCNTGICCRKLWRDGQYCDGSIGNIDKHTCVDKPLRQSISLFFQRRAAEQKKKIYNQDYALFSAFKPRP